MGQQMVDKFMGFRVVNSGTTLLTGDKQHSSPVKKVPLRELLNETQNMISKAPDTSPLSKDKPSTIDSFETRNLVVVPLGNPRGSPLLDDTQNIAKSSATSPLSKVSTSSINSVETRNLMATLGDSQLRNENIVKSRVTSPLYKDSPSTSPLETKNIVNITLGGSPSLNEYQNIVKSPTISPPSKDNPSTVGSIETRNLRDVPLGSPSKTPGVSQLLNETQNIAKSQATSLPSKDNPSSVHFVETRNLMAILGGSPLLNETQNIAKSPITSPRGSPVETMKIIGKKLGGSPVLNELQNIVKSPATSPPSKDSPLHSAEINEFQNTVKSPATSSPSKDSPSAVHSAEIRNLKAIPRGSPIETRNMVGKALGGSLVLNETQNIAKSPTTSPLSKDSPSNVHSTETRNFTAIPRGSIVETWNISPKTLADSLLPNETQNIAKSPATSLLSKGSPLTVHSAETRNLMAGSPVDTRNIVDKTPGGSSSLQKESQNMVKSPDTFLLAKDSPSAVHSVETKNLMDIQRESPVETWNIVGKTQGGSSLLNETPNIAKSPATYPPSKDSSSMVHSVEIRNLISIPRESLVETLGDPRLLNEAQNIPKSPATTPLDNSNSSTVHSGTKNLLALPWGTPNIVGKTSGRPLLLNETQNIKAKSPATSPLPKGSPSAVHSINTRNPIVMRCGSPAETAHSINTRNLMVMPCGSPVDTMNIVSKTLGGSPSTTTLSGRKRKYSDLPSSPSTFQHPCNIGASGPLVYVRRKLDTEPYKLNISEDMRGASSPDPKTSVENGTKEPNVQMELTQESENTVPVLPTTRVAPRPNTDVQLPQSGLSGEPVTGLSATPSSSTVLSDIPTEISQPSSGNLDWKERFIRLQMFLKSCDESSQENYITKLRSLSAAGRNQLAVDLEKRAIQLLVDEGIELHRMKVLNVLGKALPNESLLTHNPSPSQAQFERESLLTHNPSPSQAQLERGDNMASAAKLPLWRN